MRSRLPLLVAGDLNGFLGLAVDNLSVLALLAAVLIGGFGMPADVVYGRMFPGTALGVLIGDAIYTALALRLARRSGRDDVTAMPFGLDTPSTVGMALLVLGPAFARWRERGLDPHAAAMATWYLGMAATVTMGLIKLPLALVGRAVQRLVPRAGLLGSLAGIAMVLIGFLPLVESLREPVVGFTTLGLILYALVGRPPLSARVPGVLLAVLAGTALHYLSAALGLAGAPATATAALRLGAPHFDGHLREGLVAVPDHLALILPFALLTVVGGVNNAESARAAGDDYDVREVLLGEAVATLLAGLAGGVAQTTPYIGHPAYKRMGARAGYTLLAGLFIGLGGMFGTLAQLLEWLPLAVLAPVLVFVSLDLTAQAFAATPPRHAVAVVLSFFPSVARMLTLELSNPAFVPAGRFATLMTQGDAGLPVLAVIVALGNGFILTATLWAAFVVEMTEGRLRRAAAYLAVGGLLCLFGVIHSVRADGGMYALWTLTGPARRVGMQFLLAYVTLCATLLVLSLRRSSRPACGPSH